MITKFASSNSHFKNQKFIFFVEEKPTATAAENPTNTKMTVQDLIDGITKEIGLFDPRLLETILDPSDTRTADVLKNAKKGKKGTGIRLQTDYDLTDTEKENLKSYSNLHEKVIAAKKEREQNAAKAETKKETVKINTEVAQENVESYTVQKGDTFSKIAKKYHTTARAIYDYNVAQYPENWTGRNINSLKINEIIFVPKPGTHLIATVLEEEKTAGVERILDQPHRQIEGMKNAATAKEVRPELREQAQAQGLMDAIDRNLQLSVTHTLNASTKFRDYSKEARRLALSTNNIEEHGWLRLKHDSGLLGLAFNGNEDDVIKEQQEYWLTNLNTDSPRQGAGWETGRLLRNTVISSAAATAVDNLVQLATYGTIPEAIPVTILSKLGEVDLGIRGRKSVQFSENDPGFQFMAQFSAAYDHLKSIAPEMENILNDLQKNPNNTEAQAKWNKLKEKPEIQEALQNFEYLANYASFDRLTNLQKGIKDASTRREQNIPDSMELARFMEPADRRSYLEFIRTLQNLKKEPGKNADKITDTYRKLDNLLSNIRTKTSGELMNYREYGSSYTNQLGIKIYRIDRTLIAEHLFRSTEQGQKLLETLEEGYIELGGRVELNEEDKTILSLMKERTEISQQDAQSKQEEFVRVQEENERRKEKEEGHLDQKLGSRASLVLFGLTENSRYAWGTLGRKKGIDDAIKEGKTRYEKYDFSPETIAEGKNQTFNQEKTKWLRDHGSVQGTISGTLNYVGEHIDYQSIESWKKGNQEWEKGESTPIKNILKLLEKIWGDDAIKSMIAIYNGTAKDRMVNADHAPFVNAAVDTLFPILRDMGISDLMKPLTQEQIQMFELKKTDIDQAVFHLLDQRIFENMDKGGKKRHEYEVFASLEKEYATLNEIAAKGKETAEYTKALENFMRALEATLEEKLTQQQRELLNTIAENAAYINQVNATVERLNIEKITTDMTVHPDTPEHLERLRKLENEGKELHEKFLHEFVVQKAFNADTSPEIIAAELEKYNQQFKSLRHQIENEGTMVDNLQQDKETIKTARDELVSKRVEKSYRDLNLEKNVNPETLDTEKQLIYYTYQANQLIRKKAGERYIPVGPEIFKQGDDSIDKQVAKAKDFYELLKIADLSDWERFKTSIGPDVSAILEEHHTDATTGKFGMMAPDEEIMGHYGLNINMLQLLLPAEKIPEKTERPPIIETWQKTFSMIGLEVSNSEILTALSQGTDLSPQEVKAKYGNTQNTGVYYFPEKGDKNAEFLPKEGEFAYEITFHRYIYTPTENITVTYNVLLRDKCFNVNIPNLGLIQSLRTPSVEPTPVAGVPPPQQFEPTSFAGHAQIPSTLLVGWRFEIPRGGEIPGEPNVPKQPPPKWDTGQFVPPEPRKPNNPNEPK